MSNWPFRFVHASDFHLEMPPFGVAEVPETLREPLLESAYMAAQQVFETVVGEDVDFLVLAGDLLHCRHTGPRGPLFLAEQFERLAAAGIDVYWAAGRVDPSDDWPPSIRLPQNVHRFTSGKPEELIHRREATPLARIIGAARSRKGRIRAADFDPAIAGGFTIAVAHGQAEPEQLKASRVDYWALGGRHDRLSLLQAEPFAHYSGSPQGRQPEECGPHGCTLVQVDENSQIQTSLVPTDAIRWHAEIIEVDRHTTLEGLEEAFRQRVEQIIETAPGTDHLICWKVVGAGDLPSRLRKGPLAEGVLHKLREQFGSASPAVWSVGISAQPGAGPPRDWYQSSTLRGDFLQAIKKLRKKSNQPLDLECFIPKTAGNEITRMAHPGGSGRRKVLREAALLGAELLSGEEAEK